MSVTNCDYITIKGPFDVEDGTPVNDEEFEAQVLNMASFRTYEGRVTLLSDGFVSFTIDNDGDGQRRTWPISRVHEIEWADR